MFQNASGNLMNTLSRFLYPRLRIAVNTLGASGGEKTFSLRFSQPSGAVTTASSKTLRKSSAASTLMTPMPLFAILLTSQPRRRAMLSDSRSGKLATMSLIVDAMSKFCLDRSLANYVFIKRKDVGTDYTSLYGRRQRGGVKNEPCRIR